MRRYSFLIVFFGTWRILKRVDAEAEFQRRYPDQTGWAVEELAERLPVVAAPEAAEAQ
jgi:hypothetical protein